MMRALTSNQSIKHSVCSVLVLLSGCATFGPGMQSPYRSSPRTQTELQPELGNESDILSQALKGPVTIDMEDSAKVQSSARIQQPPEKPMESADPFDGPTFVPPRPANSARLQLVVNVPDRKQVGSDVTYRLRVVNAGSQPADDVEVEVKLDDALVLPGRDEKTVRQTIGRMLAGDRKDLALTLTSDQTGEHSCRFRVLSAGTEHVWKSVKVAFVERRLNVKIVGPVQRTLGSRAEFVAKLFNVSPDDLTGLRAHIVHDASLQPKEASTGVSMDANELTWEFGTLKAGEGIALQVEFECPVPAENARLLVTVQGDNFPEEQVEAYLAVTPRVGILDLQVADREDPIRVGEETEYLVSVENRGIQPANQVHVQVQVPPELRVVSVNTQVSTKTIEVDYRIQSNRLDFDPIESLDPDGRLLFTIRVKALKTQDCRLYASVTHAASQNVVVYDETTTVNP